MNNFSFSILLVCAGVFSLNGCSTVKVINGLPRQGDETFSIQTEDGWQLAVEHYGRSTSGRTPVILCHGLGYNGRFWNIDQSVNFARYLVEQGYDVWVLSLRGAGLSSKPGISILKNIIDAEVKELRSATFAPSKQTWNIDHYIRFDIPAAIDFVCEKTGAEKVTWIGHSLGGMIMYGYLGLYSSEKVQGLVTVGSPIIIPQPPNDLLQMFFDHKILFKTCMLVNTRTGATTMAPFHRFLVTPDEALMYNVDNTDRKIMSKVLEYVVEDLPVGVIDQVFQMVKFKEFISYDKSINYTQLCERITVPSLICCGKADNLASPESVRYAFQAIQSSDKTFKMFARINRYTNDYGHNDLILGLHAKEEVYPVILDWLDRHTRISN